MTLLYFKTTTSTTTAAVKCSWHAIGNEHWTATLSDLVLYNLWTLVRARNAFEKTKMEIPPKSTWKNFSRDIRKHIPTRWTYISHHRHRCRVEHTDAELHSTMLSTETRVTSAISTRNTCWNSLRNCCKNYDRNENCKFVSVTNCCAPHLVWIMISKLIPTF